MYDTYAVKIVKIDIIVGHMPKICIFALYSCGKIDATITGNMKITKK